MTLPAPLAWLLRPLAPAPLVFVGVVAIGLQLAGAAGLFGLPIGLLLFTWTWTYAFVLVEYQAHGRPLPVLSIEMTNPAHERRPLALGLLLLGVASLAWWLETHAAHAAALAAVVMAIVLFPASLAVLAIEGRVGRALWPPALLRVAAGLGRYYLLLGGTALGFAMLWTWVAPRLPSLAATALGLLLLLSLATLLGGALYERRAVLGIDAWASPERDAALRAAAAERDEARALDEVYGLVRSRHPTQAWERLATLLAAANHDPATCRALRDRAATWDERSLADRLTRECVTRLVALDRAGDAVLEVESWWRRDGTFTARDARELDILVLTARDLGHAATAERLRASGGSWVAERGPP